MLPITVSMLRAENIKAKIKAQRYGIVGTRANAELFAVL